MREMVKFCRKQIAGFAVLAFGFFLGTAAVSAASSDASSTNEEPSLLTLNAAIKTEGIYETNVFKTRFNPIDDFYGVVQPQAALRIAYKAFELDLGYQPRFYFFSQNNSSSGLRDIAQDLKFNSVLFSTDHFRFVLKDNLNTTRSFFAQPETPNNMLLQNTLNPQLIFAYELGPRTVLETLGEFQRVDIQSPGQDYMAYGGSIGITRELNPMFGLLVKGQGRHYFYDDLSNSDYTSIRGEAGLLINVNDRISGQILGHHDNLIFNNGLSSSGWGYSAALNVLVTETTHFTFDFRRDLSVDNRAQIVTGTTFKGSLTQELGPRTQIFGEAYHTIFDVPNFSPVSDRIWGARGGIYYFITENLRAGARYEFDANIGPTVIDDFKDHRGIISLDYDFGALVSLF